MWRHNLTFCVLINNRILSGKLFVLRGGLASPWHVENKGNILRHFLTCNIPHNNVVSRWKIAQATSFSGTNLMWVAARISQTPQKVNLYSYESAIIMSSARPHIQKWPSSSLLPKSPTDAEHNYAYSYLFNGVFLLAIYIKHIFFYLPGPVPQTIIFFFRVEPKSVNGANKKRCWAFTTGSK